MSLIVQKFGGTSVANATKISAAAQRAVAAKQAGHQVVMVVSARGHKTDELIELARDVTKTPPPREMDMLLATGEQESVALVAMAVHELGEKAVSLTGSQIGIFTDSTFTKSRIKKISTERIRKELAAGKIVVAAGFQGVDDDFNITTLGRGGSDTTATALAAVLEADLCEIYTDVEGVFTTDPRQVKEARKVNSISYDEMLELASSGAGVMHSRSIEFAKKYRVPLCVRPSYSDGSGTYIVPESDDDIGAAVTGVALVRNEVRVSLRDIPDRPGVMSLILSKMATRKIPIDMVVQDIGTDERAEVSFTVPQDDLAETLTAAEEAIKELGTGQITHGTNVSKVSAVGVGMRTHSGVAAQMFESLAQAGIHISMITTSDIKISVLVDRDKCEQALQIVHTSFGLDKEAAAMPHIGEKRQSSTKLRMNREQLERDVVARLSNMEDIVVSEVHIDTEQSRITLRQLPDIPGISATIFTAVANGGVMVDMIVQNIGHDGRTHLSFTVPRQELDKCLKLIEPVLAQWQGAFLTSDAAVALLSVRGIGLRTHTGVGEKMFRALAEAEVNIQMINTSEIRISTVVAPDVGEQALAALNAAFGL